MMRWPMNFVVNQAGNAAFVATAVFAAWLNLGLGSDARADDAAYRKQIETDWQQQDECRMMQIRSPGVIRYPGGELTWPGVPSEATSGGDTVRVPKVASVTIDGRLEDPAWSSAALLPAGPPDQPARPSLWLCHDGTHLLVGAKFPTRVEACFLPQTTALDASGAVDGVKNGRYAFHTNSEPNPWWQVDLGSVQPIGKVVIYNRLDYPPGLHNADILVVFTSDDGRAWTRRYDHGGKPIGGVLDGKPLAIDFAKSPLAGGSDKLPGAPGKLPGALGPLQARFVRIQLPSATPIFLHLDEVEIYSPDDAKTNLALRRPAQQSSLSPWSRGGDLVALGMARVGLGVVDGKPVVAVNGRPLPAQRAAVVRHGDTTQIEAAIPLAQFRSGFPPEATPFHSQPCRLSGGRDWRIVWPAGLKLGYGRNRVAFSVESEKPIEPPATLSLETVVLTPQGPRRKVVAQKTIHAAGPLSVEIPVEHEGAAAVVITAVQGSDAMREGRAFFVPPVLETLRRAEQLAKHYGIAVPGEVGELTAEADRLCRRECEQGPSPAARDPLYRRARWAARRTAFANPTLQFQQLLFVKRFTQESYPDVCLNHMPWVSRPGGDLCVLSLAGPERQGDVRNIIQRQLGPGHVHGMDLWYDGTRIVFGYAKAKTDEPPKGWLDRASNFRLRLTEEPTHLFQIGVDGRGLRQLTSGEWSDLDPTYLSNGDIAFVSERCGYSLQCNEYDKDETSTNLYVMRPDGSNIRRLSVTKDGDYLPHALDDGTIGYTRWEYQERSWANIQSFWTVRPDGTGADAVFKQHFNDPWAVEDLRSIPTSGATRYVGVAAGHHTLPAGPVIVVTPSRAMNNPRGLSIVTPGVLPPEGGMTGAAVSEGGVLGSSGYYSQPWPLSESTFLVSYGAFGHGTGVAQEIDPAGYALYVIDVFGTKEMIYRDPKISCFAPMPLAARKMPPILADQTNAAIPYAVCSLSNVGKGVPGVDPKQIKFIRIAHGIAWPYCNTFGGQRYEPDVKSVMINWNPVRVIGDVPVEADGSAQFRVPVDTPVYFQLLDANYMELRRMRSFISFQPGESRGCVGCHESREEAAAAPTFAVAHQRPPVVPVPPPWGDKAISFLRDVQPVLDRHCTACHSGLKPAAELDFSGGLTTRHNRAYDTILQHKLVARSNVSEDARITMPLEFGSHKSKLVAVLRSGACSKRAKLSQEDWYRLVTWIDANGPYHDDFLNKRLPREPYDMPNDAELAGKISAVHARRCGGCHAPAEVSRLDWIDLARPQQSRFLAAPIAKVGGKGVCTGKVYRDATDPDYAALKQLVESAVRKAWALPRRDMKAMLPPRQVSAR